MSTVTGQGQQSTTPHAPLASLAAHWHACKGDIPPPLVGASVTLVDDVDPTKSKLYLFGGRLVTTRRMMNDLYELDLTRLRWTKLFSSVGDADDDDNGLKKNDSISSTSSSKLKPQPRYFHSCNLWERKLIIFGGMGYLNGNESELCVLNEVVAFDLTTYTWDLDFVSSLKQNSRESEIPQARYAHLSSTTVDSLIVIGGQDMANRYVEEINVLDLKQKRWIVRQAYEKQRGSYRSLAVEPLWKVEEASVITRNPSDDQPSSSSKGNPLLSTQAISTLPTSYREWSSDGKLKPLPVYVYTNYNFTDVKREMEVVSVEVEEDDETHEDRCTIQIEDQSQAMSGISLPPGLRFPMGAVLGSHMLISGTYLANTSQTFAIWALHLPTMTWNRLDVGPLLSTGSWNRGILWPLQNRLVVFGHRERDLVADYNHRQTNWDHVLLIELEAWGITQPPVKEMSMASIQLGLQKLASSTVGSFSTSMESGIGPIDEETGDPILSLGGRGDFEIICADGMSLGCDRIILEKRWPWFAEKMREYQRKAKAIAKSESSSSSKKGSRPSTGEQLTALLEEDEDGNPQKLSTLATFADPRITPRQLHISEPSPVVLALLIFFYTKCVCTQLQQHPAIVAALLIVSKVYDLKDLEIWAKHTAHVVMSRDLAPRSVTTTSLSGGVVVGGAMSRRSSVQSNPLNGSLPPLERHRLAVALYEAATMSGFEALQIRSLRTVMSIAKWVQRSSIASNRSSATHESSTDAGGNIVQTPTTATIGTTNTLLEQQQEQQHQIQPRSPDGGEPYTSLRSGASSIASPSISRRGSLGKSNNQENNDKRPSRIAGNLGMSGIDANLAGESNSSSQLTNTGSSSSVPLSRTSTQGSQSTPSVNIHASPPPPIVTQRRPSAVSSSSNGSSSIRPPPLSGSTNVTTTRKRFSIFGRGNDQNSGKSVSPLENHQEEKSRSSNDSSSTFSKLQRSNTSGSGNKEINETMSNKSVSSLNTTTQNTNDGSSNVSPTAEIPRKSTNSISIGSRFRSVGGGGGSGVNNANSFTEEDPIAEATVITPTLASSKQMISNTGGLPSPVSTTSKSSSGRTLSVTGGGGGGGKQANNNSSNGNRKKMDAGQLNPKDIKALHGIFA